MEKATAVGSATVLGRINVTTDHMTRFDPANAASEHSSAGMPKQRACPHIAPLNLAADPNGSSRAAADAVRVGSREAFGVRQLAAALFLWPNNVSVPISASEGYLHRLREPRIETRDDLRATPQSGGKTQTTSLSPYSDSPQKIVLLGPPYWLQKKEIRRNWPNWQAANLLKYE
ncbi:MAG TPA: hypothetical protein PLW35_02765 [Verrucomicrobiota bacterium]|nr:hypothetical protein [Verrucomicrobiota bacterium]